MSFSCGKCKVVLESDGSHTKCTGCNNRYHYGCSVSSTTWKAKSQQLKDEWRCESCRKNGPPKTPTTEQQPLSRQQSSLGNSLVEQLSAFESKCKSWFTEYDTNNKTRIKNLTTVMESRFDKLTITLIKKLEELEANNVALKNELSEANAKISSLELKMMNSNSLPLSSFPLMNSNNQTAVSQQARSGVNYKGAVLSETSLSASCGAPPPSVQSKPPAPPAPTPAVATPSTSSNPSADEGWTAVHYPNKNKKKPAPKIGTKQASVAGSGNASAGTLSIVRPRDPRPRTSALFVTRFAPTVTSNDIKLHVEGAVKLSQIKVSKIKSKYQDHYASFHVQVLSSEFTKIDDVSIWPDGCLIKTYLGRLLPDVVVDENAASHVVDPAGTGDTSNPSS